jgi:mRNA interferase MazF
VRRGDLVTVVLPGEFGKPRPAVVVQAEKLAGTGLVTLVPLSSTLVDAPLIRPLLEPTPTNGLREPSQAMVDVIMSVRRDRVGARIGRLEDEAMLAVTRSLAVFLGIA